jgi:hypothetical protein
MSERSSRCELAAVALLCACGSKPPEADPAAVATLAATLLDNSPVPAAAPQCKPEELGAPVTVTYHTLRILAGKPIDPTLPEQAGWINPPALETPAIHTLADAAADTTAKRRAAAEVLAAPAWIVYRVDLVNAPMALGVKELKIGTINSRIIRYDRKSGQPTCVTVFNFQNTQAKSDWAISVSNRPYIDAGVVNVLREDLAVQYAKLLPHAPAPTK